MNDNQEARVHAVRMDSTRSANEIINGLDNLFRLKDLDLFLVDRFMCPTGLPLSEANPSWRERDHRQASMIYGGAIAALGILMHSAGALLYMPLVVFILVLSRFLHLRNEINIFARRKSTHSQMLDIVKYAVLREKVEKKPTIFSDMYIKYSTLRYIKNRRNINGKNFLTVFLSFDKTLQFSDMLNEVVDDVLNYVIEQEHSDISDLVRRMDSNDEDDVDFEDDREWTHTSPENGFLQDPPDTTQKDKADSERKKFSSILKKGAATGAGAAALASISASSATPEAPASVEAEEKTSEPPLEAYPHQTVPDSEVERQPVTSTKDDSPTLSNRDDDEETEASQSPFEEEETAPTSSTEASSSDDSQGVPGEDASDEGSDSPEFEDDEEVTYEEFSEGGFDLDDLDGEDDPADSEVEGSSDDDFLKELGIE